MKNTSMEKRITFRRILHFYFPLNLHIYFTLYRRWKKKSKYLDDDSAAELGALIEERRILEQELSELKKALPDSLKKKSAADCADTFKLTMRIRFWRIFLKASPFRKAAQSPGEPPTPS